ncbi:MAG: L-aspartate oxidase [Acidobacteriota bacterium]
MATHDTDFLIIGSGIAGLRAAIGLADSGRALILTKAEPSESNTGYAQGGIAAAIGGDDSPALHAADTIRAGDGLCDEAAVAVLVEEGVVYVRELMAWGTGFDCEADGRPALGREAAHSVRRVLHAGDATGREIGRVLRQRVSALPSVTTIHHALVTELLVEGGEALGVRYFDREGRPHEVRARATLLATGGAGLVFSETTNPPVATGDGIALAFHAGARLADLEFVQFHPTALNLAAAPRFLISEALRGEGARLVDEHGKTFMARYHPDGDLAPRDVVARSIVREIERTHGAVFLTLAHLDAGFVRSRFPTIAEMCGRLGLDLARDPIPVGPAAHYIMGGVDTDEWGRTSLAGLFAAGEVACTGVHGANRLASNSLLEGLVFGARSAIAMQEPLRAAAMKSDRKDAGGLRLGTAESTENQPASLGSSGLQPPPSSLHAGDASMSTAAVRDLMWWAAGLFRTRERLQATVARFDAAYAGERIRLQSAASDDDWWRHFNLLTVARVIARAALAREESRGGHFRDDFPDRDDRNWKFHAVVTRGAE